MTKGMIGRLGSAIFRRPANVVRSPEKTLKWKALKGAFKGRRAFLVGNGPSLNRTPLHLLSGEHTLCFNRFNLMFERIPWRPTMYMCVDERVARDIAGEMRESIESAKYAFFPDIHPSGVDFREFVEDRENIYWLTLLWDGFFTDLPRTGLGGTVANAGLQVLAYMGFNPIYLVGVDMDYKDHPTAVKHDARNWTSVRDDDVNHFDPRYFGKGREYHYPRLKENMLPSMKRAREETEKLGIKVYNAGVGGSLEYFPRVEFKSVFKYNKIEDLELFLKTFKGFGKKTPSSLQEAFPEAQSISSEAEWEKASRGAVITGVETAVELIPKAVFTHIPYGPVDGLYLFLKRD